MSAPDSNANKEVEPGPDAAAEVEAVNAAQADATEASSTDADADDNQKDRRVPFAESDWHETKMTYDSGKVPLYVAAVWLVSVVGLIAYYFSYALPDLESWGMP